VTAAAATRLGSYEIIRMLARGGMAELFLAQAVGPEGFAKLVVLKKILPKFAANKRFMELFLDEARLAATFDHPHIAHVYDMGTVGGDYFFTMEYIHGQDVRSLMRRATDRNTSMPIEHVVMIAATVAGALHYAHEQRRADGVSLGIVHRDVSPSNILISYDGVVKLVDFGVAKAANSSAKTRTGSIKGKLAYMSPEQASGFAIDRRSDIFSLGIVMWEMVTGSRLYKEENDLRTIQKVVHSPPPPPTELRPDCPPELERIIMRALAKSADDRFQTAEEVQLALEELAREHKLSRSNIALRERIHTLFDVELAAWQAAQASGTTLAQHVVKHPELTTPLGGSDVYSLDEEDDGEQETSWRPPPAVLRSDGTPLPVAEFVQQHPWPIPTPPSMEAVRPRSVWWRRRGILIGAGATIGVAALIALAVGGRGKSTPPERPAPAASEPTPSAPPPSPSPPESAPSTRTPTPAPAPTPDPPPAAEPAPIAAPPPTKQLVHKAPSRPPHRPVKPSPSKPQVFDPNDPLPPKP
jgi:serine/threonine protein kinase